MENAVVEISDKHVIHFKRNIFKVPKAFNDLSFMISSVRFFSKTSIDMAELHFFSNGCTLFGERIHKIK